MDKKNLEKKETAVESVDKKKLAFGKLNFILIAIGVVVVLIGFFLMAGDSQLLRSLTPQSSVPSTLR